MVMAVYEAGLPRRDLAIKHTLLGLALLWISIHD